MKQFFEMLLYAPASRRSLIATRVIVSASTLWLVLSRPMLWEVTEWPRAMFPIQHPAFLLRFGFLLVPVQVEHALYLALPLLLIAVMFGLATRFSAVAASILLYHFGPLEQVFSGLHSNGTDGFAFATLALAVLAFADTNDGAESSEYRWPVVFIQSLVALQYLLGGLSKLRFTGLSWYRVENLQKTLDEMVTLTGAPWGHAVASSFALSLALLIATIAIEYLFPLTVFSRRARWIIIPGAVIGAFLRAKLYGFYTLGLPLLLVFVNWDWVLDHVAIRRSQPAVATD